MTSEQLRERAQKFLDGAEWDAATVGGEQEIRLLTSLLASIRAETLEEAAKIADNFGPSRPLGVSASHSILCRGRWEGEQAASKNIAAAIRDAGKKE